jgi:leader peptidase (prepilin peptidase) / N-methyltransferase
MLADAYLFILSIAAMSACIIAFPGMTGVFGAGLALLMLAIARFDLRYYSIPNELSATAFLLGLTNAALDNTAHIFEAVALAVLRGVVLAIVFLALRVIYKLLRGQEGLGLGDVKLVCVAGVWLDWIMIPIAIEIAAMAALIVYLIPSIYFKQAINFKRRIPFGFFLAPAVWLSWFIAAWLTSFGFNP